MTSSMKYINLDGLTPLQIIQKYEELLLQRENIIKQLSNQLNDSQQKYIEVSETIEQLTNKNKELNDTKLKCDKTLNQHRTDKDLLFIKLNNLISENDKLTNLIKGKKDPKSSSSPHGGNKKKEKEKDKNKDKDKDKNKNKIINDNKSQNIRLELKKEETTKNNISQKYEVKLKEEKIENNKSENDKSKDENKDKDKDKDNLEIKDEKKIENININNVINEENKDKKEDKKEDIKSEDKKEDKKEDKNKEEKGEPKSQSEKRIIVVNPEEYLAKRRKKHKSGKKLMSEKISYDPVFK